MSQARVSAPQKAKRPVFVRPQAPATTVRILLHSDDLTVRETVRRSLGNRLTAAGPGIEWIEVATPGALIPRVEQGGLDLLILDGEAAKNGGMGLCRQLKNEIYRCPDVLVLTGREEDSWLASWSLADAVVPHPIDPLRLHTTVTQMLGVATA